MLESGTPFFEKCLPITTYVDFNDSDACNAQVTLAALQITLLNKRDARSTAIDNVFPF
jgi:hypothetical protein